MADRFLDLPLERLLEDVAARKAAPSGGSVAAITLAFAAGLVAMAARFSDRQLPQSDELAREVDEIRQRVGALADADAEAYAEVLASRRSSEAVQRATRIPLELCERGAVLVERGVLVARDGNRNLRGDAVTGVLLAAAAVRSTAQLVRLNVEAAVGLEDYLRKADHAVATVSVALHGAGLAE